VARKISQTARNLRLRTSVWAVASSLALATLPLASEAAGLGQMTVFSALGQPLRAEVEIFATPDELAEMQAKLAAPDEFKRAGVDYSSTLLGISFAITKNPRGRSVIKLRSARPINDPFVDLLLELNWATGRLVRDYTFLLDPPEFAAKGKASAVPALVSRPLAPERSTSEARLPEGRVARPVSPPPVLQAQPLAPPAQGPSGGGTHRVERGETLSKIARETRPEGVSLDQMLVGLFRANEDAFDRGNMNRLRAGKILSIPEKSTLESIPQGEAKRLVIAQSSDWSSYRRKLASAAAAAPAAEEEARQQASGKITTKVDDTAAPPAEPMDQLKVSKSELAGGKPATTAKRSDEDLIAKEQALKEANERLAALERNVAELQRLVELKNQSLAELEKQSAGQPALAAPVAAAVPAAAPAVAMEKPAEPPAPPAVSRPSEVPAPAEQKAEEARSESKAAAPSPVEPPKQTSAPKAKIVLPPPEEPSFVEGLLTSTPVMAGGGGILALLAAYWLARRRRQSAAERPLDSQTSTLGAKGDSLIANSVFRSTGGQSVDTSHSMAQTDFSQVGPGSIDTDEVDPVAEADVYMAYGRDAQAEEILLEARQKDPGRLTIHLKLLEIYFGRRDVKPFDALATELFNATGGIGSEWGKAAEMGLQLDSRNALFGSAAQAEPALATIDSRPADDDGLDPGDKTIAIERPLEEAMSFESPYEKTMVVGRDAPAAHAAAFPSDDTLVKPAEPKPEPLLAQSPKAAAVDVEATAASLTAMTDLADLDFDLGKGDGKPQTPALADDDFLETTLSFPNPAAGDALDFDLATSLPKAPSLPDAEFDDAEPDAPPTPVDEVGMPEETMLVGTGFRETSSQPSGGFDFEFDLGPEEAVDQGAERKELPLDEREELLDIGTAGADSLEFDVMLTESTVLGEGMQHPSFDMASISLDLDLDDNDGNGRAGAAAAEAGDLPDSTDTADSLFEADQEDTLVNPDFSTTRADSTLDSAFASDMDLSSEVEISSSEEVATKIDLAKAYQEMGDLEGARELLQEVIKDGDAAQREAALAILGELRE
jgi:pilus assembly protein FimV